MKINLEVDCTPEEARRAMGLPDLTPVHDQYIAMLLDTMSGKAQPELLENLFRAWGPMSDATMGLWKQLFDAASRKG